MEQVEWILALFPLGLLLVVFFSRLLYAPYALYKEVASDRDKYKKIALETVDKRKIRDQLSQFLLELNTLVDDCRKERGTKGEIQEKDKSFRARVHDYLANEPALGHSYVAMFNSAPGIPVPKLDDKFLGRGSFHAKLYGRLYWQTVRLQEFIKEFSS
jgi:hypothetical protein